MKYVVLIFLFACSWACRNPSGNGSAAAEQPIITDTAAWVLQRAIEKHGGAAFTKSHIEFDFRGRHYTAYRDGGLFNYQRAWQDSTGRNIRDILSNDGLYREIDGQRVDLSPKDSAAYASSVNSVVYFALLPLFLNDPAVLAAYLGQTSIRSRPYYKIKVTFAQEGGGKDYEDEYVYWINRDSFTMDYLAYNYRVDGGGARFREAYNIRMAGGIRFADYINYQPVPDTLNVEIFDRWFEAGAMKELSRIETEHIRTVDQ